MRGKTARPPGRIAELALLAAPFVAILVAKWATGTELAARYPRLAALLFLWIAADSLTLSLVARSPARKPPAFAVTGALASAAVVVLLGAAPPVRDAFALMPLVTGGLLLLVAFQTGWAVTRMTRAYRRTGNGGIEAALGQVLPAGLLRFAKTEAALLRIALLRWNAKPDIPARCIAFACHAQSAPMLTVLAVLQAIELGVTHLLLAHWFPYAALVLSGISLLALVYMVGLIKSLRLRPILLTPKGVRIRTGGLIERFVPYHEIARLRAFPESAEVKAPTTLNASLLAWPNMLLELERPMTRPPLLRARPPIHAIALRPDDPEGFTRELASRLAR